MIDYSVYMMTPTYSKDETPKAYAKNQVSEIWSLEKFAKHISDHNGVYSRGTVKGVISDMCECLVEQLLNGNKIQLGELGTFGISISSEGAESIQDPAGRAGYFRNLHQQRRGGEHREVHGEEHHGGEHSFLARC